VSRMRHAGEVVLPRRVRSPLSRKTPLPCSSHCYDGIRMAGPATPRSQKLETEGHREVGPVFFPTYYLPTT
jgi:hypothetical protein